MEYMKYKWTAEYSDDTMHKQFDEKGEESLFSLVNSKKHLLHIFRLDSDDGKYCTVNLVTGIIIVNGLGTVPFDLEEGEKAELIYCRRNWIVNCPARGVFKRQVFRIGLKYKGKEHIIELD